MSKEMETMPLFRVDKETCNRDGICAEVCPSRIIDLAPDGYPTPVPGARQACIRCGHCVAACPSGSLDHEAMRADQCPPFQVDLKLSEAHSEHFLRSRRSIRAYKSKPVAEEMIERLIRMARYAPSGRNTQDTEWLVLSNPDGIRRTAALVADWMHWTLERDPQTAAVMHLDKVVKVWEAGIDIIFRHAPAIIIAHAEAANPRAQTTCTIALTYLELSAVGLGLGCCWAGYFMRAAGAYAPLMQALDLPPGHQCFGAMMAGHPKYRYHRLPLRNDPKITWRR
jgi:nitroreductase/NAD-dependent dihydropyrimidine dehydrogenase PreA subunit